MRGFALCPVIFVAAALGACKPQVTYSKYSDGQTIPAGALHFALQSSSITFDATKLANSAAGASLPAQKTQDNCPKDTTDSMWWACWDGVAPQSMIAPVKGDGYLAKPVRTLFDISDTKLSGTPLATSDVLYKQILVVYANNAKSVITSVGSSAVAGYGIAGPMGGVAGGALGLAEAAFREGAIPRKQPIAATDLLCADTLQQITYSDRIPALHLFLPVTVDVGEAKPFGAQAGLASDFKSPGACWHALANNAKLGLPRPVPVLDPQKPGNDAREAAEGDGWFYRIVAASDPGQPPSGAIPVETYFESRSGARGDFPYSSCRDVTVQMTSWAALTAAVVDYNRGKDEQPNPLAIPYVTRIADPSFVVPAAFDESATINFKADCGAYVTLNGTSSISDAIDAAFTQAQNLLKAEQSAKPSAAKKN